MPTTTPYHFPFGQPVQIVQQQDRTPKRVFVLGKYASAVHATWVSPEGTLRVRALAVASEPYIFWRGEDAEAVVSAIPIPPAVGRLLPAPRNLNGPSGVALDNDYLRPLRLTRADVWLCDLVPHSLLNPKQQAAIAREYTPLQAQHNLPPATVPPEPDRWTDAARRAAIVAELREAQAALLVTLGDDALRWFVGPITGDKRLLADFGKTNTTYGQLHPLTLDGTHLHLLPLAHPRQAGRLSAHDQAWAVLHAHWRNQRAASLL